MVIFRNGLPKGCVGRKGGGARLPGQVHAAELLQVLADVPDHVRELEGVPEVPRVGQRSEPTRDPDARKAVNL